MHVMETEIVITVVICVHNAEKYLAETLESVAQQTIFGTGGEGIEVIIIDDRSNDSSPESFGAMRSFSRTRGSPSAAFRIQKIKARQNLTPREPPSRAAAILKSSTTTMPSLLRTLFPSPLG